MIRGNSVLAVITARGGSKGLPGKNIADLGGKPLIAWTIEAGLASTCIDRLILSSDDPDIMRTASEWGCEVPFTRPPELSRDDTPGIEPVLHAIDVLDEPYDYVILLQPTSPFRTARDIDRGTRFFDSAGSPACVSVVQASQSPYWMFSMAGDHRLNPVIKMDEIPYQRQRLPEVCRINGAFYIARTDYLTEHKSFLGDETIGFLMPEERSIDIDTKSDLQYAGFLLSAGEAHGSRQINS